MFPCDQTLISLLPTRPLYLRPNYLTPLNTLGLRIAINTRFLMKDRLEGIGWYTYEIARHLVEQHPGDEFIFIFDRPFSQDYIFADNVTGVHVGPPARHPLLFRWWYDYSVPRVLKKYKADVFLSMDNFCSLRFPGQTVLVVHDLSYLHFPHQIPTRHLRFYKKNMPRFLEKADQIVAISHATYQDIIQVSPLVAHKVTVIPNGVRDVFTPLTPEQKIKVKSSRTGGKDYFLYVGALHPRKNVERLIKAFDLFKQENRSDLKLILCGRFAWQCEGIHQAMKQSPYRAEIIHVGHVSSLELVELMGAARALVYPSLFEGFGLPIVEAFKSGTPVITSNISSMPEVAGSAAITIDPYNINDIALAMKNVIFDVSLTKVLISNGLERALQYNWAKSALEIYNLLKNESSNPLK